MKFKEYLTEDIEKFFVRMGPMSGQKQKHRSNKQAPARKGIWLLPIQAKSDLVFLGGTVIGNKRIDIKDKNFEKYYGMTQDEFDKLSYKKMNKIHNKAINKKLKEHYKSIKLKNTDEVWTHIGKGPPDKMFGNWPWYKVSVNEYWKLFKKTFGKELKKGYGFDGEWAEVFWETT